jgi:outer membrane immunogenic protein
MEIELNKRRYHMLKKILFSSALLAVTSHLVFASPAPYVGAGIGITSNTSTNINFGNFRGVPFNVFAGYGGVINQNFYIAGELAVTVGTAEISSATNQLKTSYGYDASILPGVMLSDHTLAFARAGIVRARFSNPGTTVTGGKFGLGLQTTVTQNIDLRGEYDFMAYRSINVAGMSTSPRSDAVNLSLVYKFE